MKIPAIKNFKTAVKNVFQNCKKRIYTEPILVQEIDFSKVSLECTLSEDTFQKQNYSRILSKIESSPYKKIIANIFLSETPMNKEVYDKLSPEELTTIRSLLDQKLIQTAETLVTISKIVKKLFDEKYGENQYLFVSIGRSLSAMANCLKFIGVDTKQIPLSNCGGRNRDIKKTVNTMIEQKEFKQYKKFLENTLKQKENKRYIFCDYAYTGKTLQIFKTLLNHRKVRLCSEKDEFIEINKFLEDIAEDSTEYRDIVQKFNTMLRDQRFDEYAEIMPMHFRSLERLHSVLQPSKPTENKLMKFCILDLFKSSNVTN